MKKIKKIILGIIIAIISLVSVFSCFKGKYTPEPILTPVSVLRPANSVNDNVINPTGTYDKFYFNNSLSNNEVVGYYEDLTFPVDLIQLGIVSDDTYNYNVGYPIIINSNGSKGMMLTKYEYTTSLQVGYALKVLDTNGAYDVWSLNNNGWRYSIIDFDIVGVNSFLGVTIGQQNNLLTDLISPVPFLFEGTSDNISWTSTGLDNPNNIQNIYFNTNLSNQAIKNILDTYIGTTSGIDIFNYTNGGVLVRCHVINNATNAFIQVIGGSTTLYKWSYDSIDTDESIWWYGIDPSIIDNGNVITSPQGNSLNGFNIYELRALFSSANDFVEQPSGDSYEQGYQDGYQAGYSAGETAGYNSGYSTGYDNGYSSGVNNVTTNPNEYNLYTYNQYQGNYTSGYNAGEEDGYNRGYLDGLDDGADTNISFQYVESVLTLIGNFLNIEVLPGIKLSYALGIVIILTIISIIKMVVK